MEDFVQALEGHDYQFQPGQMVSGRIVEHDSSGAYVDIGGKATAFVPMREVSLQGAADMTELAELLPLQAEEEFLIIREQNNDGQVMLSRRRLQMKRIWDRLVKLQADNQTVPVKVKSINRGGVLANVDGIRGFIPRSHLNRGSDLEALVGQTLTVGFLEVNPETNKLVLSQRLVTQVEAMANYEMGQVVEGDIVAIKPFGLFIELDGMKGLLHIKQISQKFISSLDELFSVGQSIRAVIVNIDEMKGRIALSTRVLEKYPGEVLENLPTVMGEAEDRARKLKGKLEESVS